MIISVNWLKKYTDIDVPIDELVTLIGARLVEIEEVIDIGKKYQGVIIAKIIKVEKHQNADKLNVCLIDDGRKAQDVERDENGYVQVVCGAPNVQEGLLVAWLPPGVTVPASWGDTEPFVLEARSLRGMKSNGMLASAKELDLGDDHDGILEVDLDAKPGDDFARLYELDDYLLDIENKSLTHRPDCFGIIGLAREIAAIQGKSFTTPEWLLADMPHFDEKSEASIVMPTVTIKDPELSHRYQAVILSGANQGTKSPLLIQSYLARVGQRPVNAIVDTTNYLMLVTGQPLHAFDYDKFLAINHNKADIIVRAARKGEKLVLLDGKTITLSDQDIVICNGETPVALAGAMGGAETEIDASTQNILLESATFNLYNLRGTQMRHGIFSEAITRFTKGQPARLTAPVLASATRLIMSATGAKRVSEVVEAYPSPEKMATIHTSPQQIITILGKEYEETEILKVLQSVEFQVDKEDRSLVVTPPYWRGDIHIPEDIAEEIGRITGFDVITPTLPQRTFRAVEQSSFDMFRFQLRRELMRAGANEIYTYSFIPATLIEKVGQKPQEAYKITNALSPDLQHYRLSITPNLLNIVHPNIKQGYDTFALFEIGKVHIKGKEEDGLPKEFDRLAFVYADSDTKKPNDGQAYYSVLEYLNFVLARLGIQDMPRLEAGEKDNDSANAYYQSGRSANIYLGEIFIGRIGEYNQEVKRALKLPALVAGFELGLQPLFEYVATLTPNYAPLSRYPGTWRDISLRLHPDQTYQQAKSIIKEVLGNVSFESTIAPIDIYAPEGKEFKNITFRIQLVSLSKTITNEEASEVVEKIVRAAEEKLKAQVV